MTQLHLLPTRTAGAAENMATDFLLLQRYPEASAPRFRHYEWRAPACTFGYSQKIEFVRANLPGDETFDLCRRPTGGGIVDHRHDWTYALVLPRAHALYDQPAPHSYRVIHECLAATLVALGRPAVVKTSCEPETETIEHPGSVTGENEAVGATCSPRLPGVCFRRAELYDVINPDSGMKIAGAAQKRNKHGLLFQGSIEKNNVAALDWDDFHESFTTALARALGVEGVETSWPEFNEDEVSGLIEQYSDSQWIEYR